MPKESATLEKVAVLICRMASEVPTGDCVCVKPAVLVKVVELPSPRQAPPDAPAYPEEALFVLMFMPEPVKVQPAGFTLATAPKSVL